MKYLLDTSTCVGYLRGTPESVVGRIRRASPSDLVLSTIVIAELRYGADRSARVKANHARVDILAAEIPVLDFDTEAASVYGRLRARLTKAGTLIGSNDMLIAAQALSRGLVVVTDDIRDFRRVAGLRAESWG